MTRIHFGVLTFVITLALNSSCAVWEKVRPVVRDVTDIAHDLCIAYEDRAKSPNLERICEEESRLKPWIDLVAITREVGPPDAVVTGTAMAAPNRAAGELSASPMAPDSLPPDPPVSAAPSAR